MTTSVSLQTRSPSRVLRPAVLAIAVAGCGGGGGDDPAPPPPQASIITNANYIDVAGVAIVAANRLQFVVDVVDAAFETAVNTNGIPGTYPCFNSGTVVYTRSGSSYTFTVNNCDTQVGGARVLLQSGSLRVDNPVVQTTTAGYFLTSAAVTFNNARAVEAGSTSIFAGAANLSSTVTSATTANGTTTGASLTVERAGRVDSYTNINMTAAITLISNRITGGSLTLSSPRAPGVLTLSAPSSTSLTATAADNSQSLLTSGDYVNYTLQFATGGAIQATSSGNVNSGPLAEAIARALQ
jgi:hypothetical protein